MGTSPDALYCPETNDSGWVRLGRVQMSSLLLARGSRDFEGFDVNHGVGHGLIRVAKYFAAWRR